LKPAASVLPIILRLSRRCDDIRLGPRRMGQGKNVVFYREESGGVFISRILHGRMLPENQVIDDQEDNESNSSEG
jgi:hypothetical protein